MRQLLILFAAPAPEPPSAAQNGSGIEVALVTSRLLQKKAATTVANVLALLAIIVGLPGYTPAR
jgi:hypothetical protein